ncbi:hypothetical protein SAMN05421504_104627 [Amycolatopsis xylanica]|uniref:Peptidase S9 prolyl oligopeptidase catalytic domain-containing protein n=1 Tax=Amycolatopsis xylanica TaxID=589385 RepID=A0A1H3HDX3_9PSEU|nr:hypothetical protein [Amycolatopsis xylanica]SDY13716.1 hypothetical protein SAMN05421504_104627 [Amycolatopsis xylanica]
MLPSRKSRLAAAVLSLLLLTPGQASAAPDDLPFTGGGGVTLHGTLIRPKVPPRAAIVLQGGSNWRVRADLRAHADMFANLGVTTLIYDRRTVGYSTTQRDYGLLADDLIGAVDALRAQPGVDPGDVGVWGVSEGAWVAPLAATKSEHIAYVITAGASAIPGASQTAWYWGNVLRHQGVSGSLLRALPYTGTRFAVGAGLFPQAGYDGVAVLKQVRQPILALWGDLDINHPPEESSRIFADALAANPNHAIRFVPGGGPDLNETTDRGFDKLPTLAPGYPAAVDAWLGHRTGVTVENPPKQERLTEPLPPLAWYESPWAQGIVLLALLGAFLGCVFLRRSARPARLLAVSGTATVVGFLAFFAFMQMGGMKNIGPVVLGRPILWLLLQLLAAATMVAAIGTAVRYRRSPAQRKRTFTLLGGSLVFVPWALYWGLLVP